MDLREVKYEEVGENYLLRNFRFFIDLALYIVMSIKSRRVKSEVYVAFLEKLKLQNLY